MIIEYYKEMSYEIDIPKLTKVFRDDIGVEKFNSEDVDDLITYFGDNTLYYLVKYGFNDTDCLEDYTLDLITEEVYKILKLWKQEN